MGAEDKGAVGSTTAPLAWWEEVQVGMLEEIAKGTEHEARTSRYREHPEEWRADREQFGRILAEQKAARGPHGHPHPHEKSCAGCRADGRCNACGELVPLAFISKHGTSPLDWCTNGRCQACHGKLCPNHEAVGP